VGENKPAREDATGKMLRLMGWADKGDEAAVAELRRTFDATPSLWDQTGDLARHARTAWVALAAGENAVFREAIQRRLGQTRRDLLWDAPTPLERLLVERILSCWLQVQYLDAVYAQRLSKGEGMTWASDDGHQRRQDRAQRRYLAAVRTVAQVRRLLGPTVQVNIAEHQNIAQVTAPGGE
jgi:hypothetical protein